jgi:hypothetical protein
MIFPSRKLKPYSEPIELTELEQGQIYFLVQFFDSEMLIPQLEPVVFLGCGLERNPKMAYFQDLASFRAGATFVSAPKKRKSFAKFSVFDKSKLGNIFVYEKALNELLSCALRRRNRHEGL